MAGEWIAYDLALPQKPEVQELIDTTGLPVQDVVFNLLNLWGWASMHCADGTARMTLPRLVRTCGATQEFWTAVASVGWLEIDETVATVAVPGWDRRFSQAAKSRAQHADRSRDHEERNPGRKRRPQPPGADAPDDPALARRRGDEMKGESHHHPREAWDEFRKAWNAGKGRQWTPATPPDGWAERLSEEGWLEIATQAIGRIGECRYFKTPMTLIQFVKPGWAEKVLGGSFDHPKGEPRSGSGDKPPPKSWKHDYRPAPYRSPKEVAALAAAVKLTDDDL
jgi:hypothetical protein